MLTRYVHHDPRAVESPGAGFPSYEDLLADNTRMRAALDLVEDYLIERVDCDCDQDGFIPNDEMRLKMSIEWELNGGKL